MDSLCLFLKVCISIMKTRLFKYTENFTTKKRKFSDKKLWFFFHISAQNIDRGYSLEPPRRGSSNGYPQSMFLSRNKKNNVYPCKPQFYYTKVGFKGVKIIQACFRDVSKCRGNLSIKAFNYPTSIQASGSDTLCLANSHISSLSHISVLLQIKIITTHNLKKLCHIKINEK